MGVSNTSCPEITTKPSQGSLESLVDLILDTTTPLQQVQFYGWVLSDHNHIQRQQCLVLAQAARVNPETARLWLTGDTGCKCGGRLYAKTRLRFQDERAMATAFGEYINRDLLKEVGL